jgi:hypothetical protein
MAEMVVKWVRLEDFWDWDSERRKFREGVLT